MPNIIHLVKLIKPVFCAAPVSGLFAPFPCVFSLMFGGVGPFSLRQSSEALRLCFVDPVPESRPSTNRPSPPSPSSSKPALAFLRA